MLLPSNYLIGILEYGYDFNMLHWLRHLLRHPHCYKTEQNLQHQIKSHWTQTLEIPLINQGTRIWLEPCRTPLKQTNIQARTQLDRPLHNSRFRLSRAPHPTLLQASLSSAHLSQLQSWPVLRFYFLALQNGHLLLLLYLDLWFPLWLWFLSFFKKSIYLFIYGCIWSSLLCGLSLVVASGGYSSLGRTGFSLWWLLLLWL